MTVLLSMLVCMALHLGCGGGGGSASGPAPPAPTVAITGTSTNAVTGPVTLTFTFSQPMSAFPAGDVTVTSGTAAVSTTMADSIHFTLVVTPPADSTGTMVITVPAGAFTPPQIAALYGFPKVEKPGDGQCVAVAEILCFHVQLLQTDQRLQTLHHRYCIVPEISGAQPSSVRVAFHASCVVIIIIIIICDNKRTNSFERCGICRRFSTLVILLCCRYRLVSRVHALSWSILLITLSYA